jgi:hypothetical protein
MHPPLLSHLEPQRVTYATDSLHAAPGDNECKDLLQLRKWCHLSPTCLHLDLLMIYRRQKLNNIEKADYIEAIRCLQSRPPLTQRYDSLLLLT